MSGWHRGGSPNDVVSLRIAAPPQRLYDLLSDITQMPRWSPETYRTRWIRGATRAVPGARFRGTNRWRWIRWTTTVEVEVADPGRELTFVTVLSGRKRTRWSYTFEAQNGGTMVTESRTSLSVSLVRGNFDRFFMRGHVESYTSGMRMTLERLRAVAEAA